jgi:ferredoxin-NADP reductase
MHAAQPFDVRLIGSKPLAPAVRQLVFERLDQKPMAFDPGQWVNLVLPLPGDAAEPANELRRAYSIASPPDGSARFELAVTRVRGGPGSEYLHELAEGATLRAIGPHGLFTRDGSETAPALMVATGTGVTPFRSMMRAAERAGASAPIWLLFGARHEEDILYRPEFDAWAAARRGRYVVTLSQPAGSWHGPTGYVQRELPKLWRALCDEVAPARPQLFICGLQRMIHTVRELARGELGVDRKHVHVERYD